MLKAVLQGRPFRHPLHTYLVHFPVGLFALSFLLDLTTWVAGPAPGLVRGATYAMAAGVLMALLAAVPGFVDWFDIRPDHPARRTATAHMALNLTLVALYAVNWFLRRDLDVRQTPTGLMLLSLLGVLLLSASGYLGGRMVYDDGIAVGRGRRSADRLCETVRVPADAARDGWIPVLAEAELLPGGVQRVEAAGVVMVLVRLDGKVYAVQEFCTHRYGPLSEGRVEDGQIICPWHLSCFDLRTGKAAKGPAKVDLRTFQAEVREGTIHVRANG